MSTVSQRQVSLFVQSQVIGTRKAALTVRTLEWFDSCVFAEMPRQLIRPSKLPCAALPHALVWFLSCVGSAVGFEVGALGVDFITACEVTAVNPSLLEGVRRIRWERMLCS